MPSGPLHIKFETAGNRNEDPSGHHIQIFWMTLTPGSSVHKPKFQQKLHSQIKLGFKFVSYLIWISFSPLLAFPQPHQQLNGNKLNEPMQRQNPHYFILIHKLCILQHLYSSIELLLVTDSYQITSFLNQTYLDLFIILLLKRAFSLGSNNPADKWRLCTYTDI